MLFTDAGAQEVNGKQGTCRHACINQSVEKCVKIDIAQVYNLRHAKHNMTENIYVCLQSVQDSLHVTCDLKTNDVCTCQHLPVK